MIDIMDDTFIVTTRSVLARRLKDPGLWQSWWPRLEMTVTKDRGPDGVHWSVAGELTGTAEIWLERWHDGVVVHWMLRADLTTAPRSVFGNHRRSGRISHRYVTSFKEHIHALKDQLETGRPAGGPPRR